MNSQSPQSTQNTASSSASALSLSSLFLELLDRRDNNGNAVFHKAELRALLPLLVLPRLSDFPLDALNDDDRNTLELAFRMLDVRPDASAWELENALTKYVLSGNIKPSLVDEFFSTLRQYANDSEAHRLDEIMARVSTVTGKGPSHRAPGLHETPPTGSMNAADLARRQTGKITR
jgi:hypothetical protein